MDGIVLNHPPPPSGHPPTLTGETVGHYTCVTGEIRIEPPLTWKAFETSPFYPPVDDGSDYNVMLRVVEDTVETEDGPLIRKTADALVSRWDDSFKAYNLLEHVQAAIAAFPGHTFTGRLECEGEDNTDMWRVEIRNGTAVKVEPTIMWPKEVAALYNEEGKRFRGKVLDEVWKALRDAEGGPMLDAMNLVNRMQESAEPGAADLYKP